MLDTIISNLEKRATCKRQQSGNILLLSLALLVVVSLLGVSSMRGALTEEQISVNIQDHHLAVEAAESALRAGERTLISSSVIGHPGYYSFLDETTPAIYDWDNANSYTISESVWGADNLQPAPRFKIELFAAPDLTHGTGKGKTEEEVLAASSKYYRVIGYGQGRSDNAIALEESIVIQK